MVHFFTPVNLGKMVEQKSILHVVYMVYARVPAGLFPWSRTLPIRKVTNF